MSIYRKVVKGFIIVVVGGGVIMERCLISGSREIGVYCRRNEM